MCKLAVGAVFNGYCNGFFGDSYGPKRVEAFGHDWIVARDERGVPQFCHFEEHWLQEKDKLIADWLTEQTYE